MKKYFYIFILFFIQATVLSCTDEEIYESPTDGKSSIKITLNVPVDNGKTRGLIYGPDEVPVDGESEIKDIYVLAFDKESKSYLGKFQSYITNNTLVANVNLTEDEFKELTIVVLTNLEKLTNGYEIIGQINAFEKGAQSKEEILKSLKYTFNEIWDLNGRPLPMWGETDITPVRNSIATGEVNLYRAISKINVVVNYGKGRKKDGVEVFKLKSVRVYYARTSGLVGSLYAPQHNEEGSNTITNPSIPEDVSYFPRYNENAENNLLFTESQEGGSYAIENKIYVPESDQKNTEEPMCLVVGGYYMGSDKETYYRVDFKQGNKGSEYYNAIRNHIYTFNINNVTRPGTDEPDPALDHVVVGMDVTIKDWTTEWMRGIGGQYTLDVSTGGFVLTAGASSSPLIINTTHNEGWEAESLSSWITYTKTEEGILIKVTENSGGERRGSIIVKSGNLEKVITIRQRGKGTANSYIVSDDGHQMEQQLIVTVKGNGEVGLVADGVALEEKDPYIAAENIGDVKIIWETADGLVTIAEENGKAKLDMESGTIKYKVNLACKNSDIEASNTLNSQNYKGGNALIGAFGKNQDGSVNYNDLLWSWHIWVCPDIDTDKDGYIGETELAAIDQKWATGYTFMDRNMGALSNKPGVPSLGLLYQWGRKDPFIGAARVSTEQVNNQMYTHLPLESYGYNWHNSSGNMTIEETTKAPTTLIKGIITGIDYASLWGTATGLKGETNAGNKTIYDPCPYGYRVPNVAAIIFKGKPYSGASSSTSEDANWYSNNEFWPLQTNGSEGGWTKYKQVTDQSSYGFWLRYDKHDSEPNITQYSDTNKKNNQQSTEDNRITWLPLSGVYDGDVNQLALVDNQNSLLTNSIMWTNSSVTVNGNDRPAGLFLHGVQASSSIDGNHFHKLKESGNNSNLYAKPQHAGALRCVRDVKVDMGEENAIKMPDDVYLEATAGSTQTKELTSLLDSWEVVDPGATWFVMTPDAGSTGSKQKLTFKATQSNTGGARTAYIKIKFNDTEGTIKSIKVTQAGLNLNDHTVTSPINLTSASNNDAKGNIVAINDSWEIISGKVSWLEISPMRSESLNNGGTSNVTYRTTETNTSNNARSTTLTIRFGNGETKAITVTQAGKYELDVSPKEMEFERKNAATQYFAITSNTTWTITKNVNWITLGNNSGNGNLKISVKCSDNDNWFAESRTGTITIKTSDGSIVKTITVYQEGYYR